MIKLINLECTVRCENLYITYIFTHVVIQMKIFMYKIIKIHLRIIVYSKIFKSRYFTVWLCNVKYTFCIDFLLYYIYSLLNHQMYQFELKFIFDSIISIATFIDSLKALLSDDLTMSREKAILD